MKARRLSLFLSLAIACFIGIIAIFVFDGYVGIYDTVHVTAGEYEQEIGPDFWQGQSRDDKYAYPYHIEARWGEPAGFRYEIANRRFSDYATTVEASLWKSNVKLLDLFSDNVSLDSFDDVTVEWNLSPQMMKNAGLAAGDYTVKIMRGEAELGKGIIINFYDPQENGMIKPPLIR